MNDVFNAPELSIIDIKNELDVIGVRAILSILISDVVEFFNVGKTMNDRQIAITCDLIIEEYPYMKIEDLKLCFKNAMKLKYGKLYDRIDGSIIIGWLNEYEKERAECASIQSDNEIKQLESNLNDGLFYQEYLNDLKHRSDLGDNNAKKLLETHSSIQSLLKNFGYEKYSKERDKIRLHGRGNEHEKKFNRNLK
jgi:hypothetical protein